MRKYQLSIRRLFRSIMTNLAYDRNPQLPNLKFLVRISIGTVLAEANSGFLPLVDEREWKFYGL